ncbi:MAG: hypothetical protein E7649_03580 [Ruminococcaceae bacterium]|nr:hypothetical protein [Oscillospiraceae bacterium]
MLTSFSKASTPKDTVRKEGELYKRISARGVTFEIFYGYYDEKDRHNPLISPMEMYPDFTNTPVYAADGAPFVTAMQKPCEHFRGITDVDNTCYQCAHFEKCEDLLGICKCRYNRKNE